MLLKAKIGNK